MGLGEDRERRQETDEGEKGKQRCLDRITLATEAPAQTEVPFRGR